MKFCKVLFLIFLDIFFIKNVFLMQHCNVNDLEKTECNVDNINEFIDDITDDMRREIKKSMKEIIKIVSDLEPEKKRKVLKHFAKETMLLKNLNNEQRKKLFEAIKINAQRLQQGKNPFSTLIEWKGLSVYSILFLSILYNVFTVFLKSFTVYTFFPVAIILGVLIYYKLFKWTFKFVTWPFRAFGEFFMWFYSCKIFCSMFLPGSFIFALFILFVSF